jgi:hypothetical protein
MEDLRSWACVNLIVPCFVLTAPLWGCGLELDDGSEEDALGIQPISVTPDANETADIVFNVWGGSGDYTWSVSDKSLGTLVAGNSTAVYTNKRATGENTIAVSDGDSRIRASVAQE